jgi:hypothetical protein
VLHLLKVWPYKIISVWNIVSCCTKIKSITWVWGICFWRHWTVKSTVFWYGTTSSFVDGYIRLERGCCHHVRDRCCIVKNDAAGSSKTA